jgi:hypothetical protein
VVSVPWTVRHYDQSVQAGSTAPPPQAFVAQPSAVQPVSFRLTGRQRLLWAAGSPARCIGFGIFLAIICWLALTTIGFAAVVVIISLVAFGHWVPFVLAGRNRLTAASSGLYDSTRFRKRHYAWGDVVNLHITSPAPFVHGIVVDVADRASDDVYGEFLRSSWRPTLAEAEDLLLKLRDTGWGPRLANRSTTFDTVEQ